MNLWDFLKYSDKYNVFKIYTKEEEIYFSWNGGSSELKDDKTLLDFYLADWKVLSYKQYPNEIRVFIELDEQEMSNYNHFPKTKIERLRWNND